MNPPVIALICILSFFAVSFLLYLFLIKTGKRRAEIDKFKSVRYAHRGLHGNGIAENSISAFRAAVVQRHHGNQYFFHTLLLLF